ncbi:dihydroorotase [Spirochaetia bacterium]|nr:dihydroorotase [Spirochaetia bacterium]
MKTLIRGGTLYDGTGAASVEADVLIDGDRIAAIGKDIPDRAYTKTIDAHGRVVTPGFVDVHRHADAAAFLFSAFGMTELAQGITTTAVGNCGIAPVPYTNPQWQEEMYRYIEPVIGPVPLTEEVKLPFKDYHHYTAGLKKRALPINMAFLAGAGAIKNAVKGFAKTPFTPNEMARATAFVQEAMEAGALGLSFGIMYQPECYSTRAELSALAKPAGIAGGVLCTHIRGEGDSLVDSVREMIEVAEAARIPLNISHFKATGIKNWRSLIFRAIDAIEDARAKGQPVTADFYPYDGGSTTLLSLIPPSVLEDTTTALFIKLATPAGKTVLRRELYKPQPRWDNMVASIGWDRIIVSSVTLPQHNNCCGKSLADIAQEQGYSDSADLVCDLLISEEGRVGIIVLSMAQEDIDEIARLPWTALISDSLYGGGAHPHPRLNGAFPKFLREYVRERKVLTMEQAIHKMTAIPAKHLGITERGALKPGYYADVLVFDPQQFTDHADYLHPMEHATGMNTVILNGTIVRSNGVGSSTAGRPVFRSK